MSSYINFILESGISLGVLTLIYFLFLRKETYFQINRIFLILSAVYSSILPMLRFTYSWGSGEGISTGVVSDSGFGNLLETVTVTSNGISAWFESLVVSIGIIGVVYLIGVTFMSLRLAWRMGQLGYLIQSGTIENNSGVRIIRIDNESSPFSFFRWLFIGQNFEPESQEGKRIVEHELEHIKQLHSVDVLAMEIISIVQWFNPFIWIMSRLVRENHEFLADRRVLDGGFSAARYKLLLLEQATGVHMQVANNFNRSILKKRIKMISKIKSTKWAALKLVVGAFVFALLTIVFACENETEVMTSEQKTSELTLKQGDIKTKPFVILDGKTISLEEFNELDPASIKSINVYKGESAVDLYGDRFGKEPVLTRGVVVASLTQLISEKSGDLNSTTGEVVFNIVEKMPEYPGGDEALRKYIATTVEYPVEAEKNGIHGKVYVHFIVDSEGNVRDARIARGIDPLLDKEALRVVSSIPKFKPGYQRGKAVNVKYTVPINFVLP